MSNKEMCWLVLLLLSVAIFVQLTSLYVYDRWLAHHEKVIIQECTVRLVGGAPLNESHILRGRIE